MVFRGEISILSSEIHDIEPLVTQELLLLCRCRK